MARQPDFVDPEYDRRLAEFKAEKARRMRELSASGQLPQKQR